MRKLDKAKSAKVRTISRFIPKRETFPDLYNFNLKQIKTHSNKLPNLEYQLFYLKYVKKHFLVVPISIKDHINNQHNFEKLLNQEIEFINRKSKAQSKITDKNVTEFVFEKDYEDRSNNLYNFKKKYSKGILKSVLNCNKDLFSKIEYFKKIYDELCKDIGIVNLRIGVFENEVSETYSINYCSDILTYLINLRIDLRKEIDSLESESKNKLFSKIIDTNNDDSKIKKNKNLDSNIVTKIKWFGEETILTNLIELMKNESWITKNKTFAEFNKHFCKPDGSEFNFSQSKYNYEENKRKNINEKGKPKNAKKIELIIQKAKNIIPS